MLLDAAMHVFFRQIAVVGQENVPAAGGIVFAGNHPNSLIDPVMVVISARRIVHFAAKDKLFAFPLSIPLSVLGCVPIMRAMDHKGGDKRDNSAALAHLEQVLVDGRGMGIFPEGLSHDGAQLARMRSGAARIALAAAAREGTVAVVPVGLTYKHRKSFRSRALVQYGEPIELGPDDVAAWNDDPREAASALTDRIEEGIRALTVNAPDWETLRVLDGVRRMYQPPGIPLHDRVELARRFCEGYERVKDQPDIAELYADVEAWLDDLDDAGLRDAELVRGPDPGRGMRNALRLLVWLPLALPGAIVHAPLILGIHFAGHRFAPRKDVVGTSRLMLGLMGVFALYVVIPALLAWQVGVIPAVVTALLLPLSGYATLRVLAHGLSIRRLLRSGTAALTLHQRMYELKKRRDALEERVVAAVAKYLPEGMVPLYPRS